MVCSFVGGAGGPEGSGDMTVDKLILVFSFVGRGPGNVEGLGMQFVRRWWDEGWVSLWLNGLGVGHTFLFVEVWLWINHGLVCSFDGAVAKLHVYSLIVIS